MKRYIVALTAGAAVFGVAFGAASALDVNGGTVQAGGDDSLYCDAGGVTLGWKTMVTGDGTFHVAGIDVVDISPECDGKKVLIALMKSPTEIVGFARGDISGTSAQAYEFFSGGSWVNGETGVGPKASDVNSVQVLIKDFYVAFDAP